jgi:hypothetical protein
MAHRTYSPPGRLRPDRANQGGERPVRRARRAGRATLRRSSTSALGQTEPLAAQAECPLSAEVRPWRGRRDRFGACWPRLRGQRRARRATADRYEHWRCQRRSTQLSEQAWCWRLRRSLGRSSMRATRTGTVNKAGITYGDPRKFLSKNVFAESGSEPAVPRIRHRSPKFGVDG